VREQATYLAYAGGWRAVRLMPERLAYATFDRIADQQWRAHGPSVRRLEANLERVVGPVAPDALRELSREGMRSYMRYWCDAFRLPGWDSARIDTFEMRHPERLADPVASGRGVVAALPHMGNWDHAGAWCSQHISPVNTVAEKLEPEQLYTAFVEFRTSLGMHIHGLGDPGVYQMLQDALVAGGLVALLADRDLSAKGVDVQFFGETARFPAGPAALAVDTGASLVPVKLFWEGHNVAEILPEIEPPTTGDRDERIRVTTQAVADALAAGIAEHPADWHMLQRVWLADLDPARLAARDASGSDA
jgi:phosphatidylinositol dimannoside acyltransferase